MAVIEVSQTELARQVGVTQGAIAKVANSNPNGSSFLHKLARQLRTTPEYLLGETDDPESEGGAGPLLSTDEQELLDHYQAMKPADRRALLQVARTMAGQ